MSNLNDGAYYRIFSGEQNQESGLCKQTGVKLLCDFCYRKAKDDGAILEHKGAVNQKSACDRCGCSVLSHSNFVADIEVLQLARYGSFCINCD